MHVVSQARQSQSLLYADTDWNENGSACKTKINDYVGNEELDQ